MNKFFLAMIIGMFTVSAFACDSMDKSKTTSSTTSEETKSKTAQ